MAVLVSIALAAPLALAQDTTAPTITSVTISSTPSFDADGDNTADTYVRGDRIVLDVRFSEAVTVSGGNNNVRLRLDMGADDANLANSRRVLMLKSVVGGDTLRFEHRVARRDSDPDGVWVQTLTATNTRTVFTVGGATVTSTATGTAAVLTTSGLPTSGAANHKVDGSRTQAPDAANRAPTFPATEPTTLEVAENNAAGAPVGTVLATDPDGDALTYALDSASDAVFDIDSSGAITVTSANALNYETKASYAVTVSVHDGKDAAGAADTTVDATRGVTITVTDVEELTSDPPSIASVTISSTPSFDADDDNTADTYVRGDRIVVDVRFSEAVTVSGGNNSVRLRLDLGADDTTLANSRKVLKLKSVVGGDTLRFEHRVARRDGDPDGVWVQTASATNARTVFTVGGATVTSAATGTAAVLTTSGLPTSGAANHKVDGSRTQAAANRAPTFPAIPEGTPVTLYIVQENNAAGAPVVTVAATDPDGDALTYALDSASDAVFDIDSSGNITVTSANALDHETKANYTVTVSVHDGKDAAGAADTTVDATRSVRIVVADAEEPPAFPANAPTTLSVAENNAAGAPVGTVSAMDPDGDALTYALDSVSDAVFDIDSSGAITVTAANALDYETKASYAVTVSVHDGKDAAGQPDTGVDATHSVTITVTDVEESTVANRAPIFSANAPTTLEVAENNAAIAPVGAVPATDPDGDALTYALDSVSDAVFDIDSSGAITVTAANALDYEAKASYAVTVSVHDGKDAAGQPDTGVDATHDVTISVTEVPAGPPPAEPIVEFGLNGGGSLTSTRFGWRLPRQPAGVTVSAVKVQVLRDGTPPWRTVASLTPVADGQLMGHTVIGLAPGEYYNVRIRLVTNSGNADSESIVFVKTELPRPVTKLSVSNVTRTTADLSWTLPPVTPGSPIERELKVQQRGANGDWTTVATLVPDEEARPHQPGTPLTEDDLHDRWPPVPTSYTVTGLTPGTSYTFRIRLVANANADSETVSTTTPGGSLNPAGGLTASNPTPTTIDLAWALPTQPAGVTVTGLEVQQQSGDSWTTVASLGAGTTTHTVTDLTEGTTYTFRVRLAANNGTVDSKTVSATALASPKPATDLAASNQSRTGIDLSWTLPAQSLGVTVSAVEVQYRYAKSKGWGWNDWAWGTVATLASDATSHTVTQVTPGTNYAFRIRLATNNGHADSESVTAAALEPPKPATELSFSNVTGTTVDLSWTLPAQPEGVIVTAVEVHSGGLIKPGDENIPNFSVYGQVELAGDAISVTWPVLHGGFTHNFRVRLVTNSGNVDSEVASWSSTRPYPQGVTDLTASNATQTTVDLAWTLPEQPGVTVSAVKVQHWETGWTLGTDDTLAADATSHTVTGLSAGTAYEFHVVLVTSSGNEYSSLSVTTPSGAESAPGVSVADASATEGVDAAVEFKVSLSQTASGTVTVDYETADASARAGQDYTAVSGTLTFASGERAKTVSVPILDDAIDEGRETFRLKLRNVQGAWISDGEAIGTIVNSDSMPKAWTARFGRSVAVHVVDAVEQRLEQAPSESWAQLGGHQLGGGPAVMANVERLAPARDLWAEPDAVDTAGQHMTPRQLLLGSAFHLVSNGEDQAGGPRLSVWGRVASSGFDGQEDKLSLDGTVTTATLGVDGIWNRWLTGLLLAYSEGGGSFTHVDVPGGDVTSSLTSLHPYVAYTLSERVRLWGMVGYGSGALRLEVDDQRAMDTDLTMSMGAAGVRGSLLQPVEPSGFQLALRSDVLWMVMDSAAADNLAATEADASRLRLVLEGSRPVALAGGGSFTPSLELGLRYDGGDAETGIGVEVGGSLRYASAWGLSIEASVRGLLSHEAQDYKEWGASGALRFDPGRQGRGFTASIAPAWGSAASGAERLWGQPGASRLPASNPLVEAAAGRLNAELGYGLATLQGRGLLTPYARVALTEGTDQAWHLGTRLALRESLNLSLEASRRAREGDVAAHELALLATLGF